MATVISNNAPKYGKQRRRFYLARSLDRAGNRLTGNRRLKTGAGETHSDKDRDRTKESKGQIIGFEKLIKKRVLKRSCARRDNKTAPSR